MGAGVGAETGSTLGVVSGRPGAFTGMDVAAMNRLVADLDRAGRELPEAGGG
ncbi:hypothetical protein AB0K60_32135 [Thermopolyspora sp. NPDC052614]|uniref:hypothetical protein n=1 Tax=Thermopolyspora sp. NPDC052614 TaxID=3155682 RepID=UPI00343E7002